MAFVGQELCTQRGYRATRKRGLAAWRPHANTVVLIDQTRGVLKEYEVHLPLTCRQIFYRLVGVYGYPKEERSYERLLGLLNRARRAGEVPFEAIRDDGVVREEPAGFNGKAHFWQAVRDTAENYRRDRLAEQPVAVEVWVEAAGMVPQVAKVAHDFGVPVYSSGGFDSLTAKYEAAKRILERDKPTVVLHIGDHDPSGLSVYDAAAEDVQALVRDLGGADLPQFRRIVVTPEQIKRYKLPEAPPKVTDKRGIWVGGTVQAEALTPKDLATEVRAAIVAQIDEKVLTATIAVEEKERAELVAALEVRT